MTIRDSAVELLRSFYDAKRLSPSRFACEFCDECQQAASWELAQGAEAHVGHRYGSARRLVVLSLDTGGGVADIERRTQVIESLSGENLNRHMQGTTLIAAALLAPDIGNQPPYPYFAMINAAKCSRKGRSMDMVPQSLYERCRPFAREELNLLEPTIVVAQGTMARAVLPPGRQVRPEEVSRIAGELGLGDSWLTKWLDAIAERYLRWVTFRAGESLAILTPHPSARYGQWQRFVDLDLEPIVRLCHRLVPTLSSDMARSDAL